MNIPDEALFYIVERDMTISDLLETVYDHPSQAIINHVLRINAHMKGDWVATGQMLIVTPPDTKSFAMLEQQMAIAARHVDAELKKLKRRECQLLARHYVLLSNLSAYNIARFGWAATRFHQHKKNLERYLFDVDALAQQPVKDSNNNADFSPRQHQLLIQIHHSVSGLLGSRLFEQGKKISAIKARLGLTRGAAVHQWKTQTGPAKTIAGFKLHYAQMIKGAKSFARTGRLSLALEVNSHQQKPLSLIQPEGTLASLKQSDFGWPFNHGAYHLVIGFDGGHRDFFQCSIVRGVSDGVAAEPLFSQRYRRVC